MAARRNLVGKLALAAMTSFFVYVALVGDGQESTTGGLVETLGIGGALLMYAAILLTFANMAVAAYRAHLAGSWLWLLGVVFFWPLGYLYTLVVNRGD